MPRKPPEMPPAEDLMKQAMQVMANFKGQGPNIESAIGFLFVGHAFGWKVLHLWHSPATVRKYEQILGIKAIETFPETTSYSDRSYAFSIAKTMSNFWKAVKGEVDNKDVRSRDVSDKPY